MASVEQEYEWVLPRTVAAFMQSDAFVRLIIGPIGSGKSSGCVGEIVRRAAEQRPSGDGIRRTRFAVVRNTYGELRDTTRKTIEQWLEETGWSEVSTWHEAENTLTIATDDLHCEVLLRALDRPQDVRKLLSLELTGAWLNEAKEIPRAVFDMIQGRVGRYPSKFQGGPTWFGVWADTNPPDTDHYLYKIFEEERPEGFALFRQPSGLALNAENVENLPQGYYKRLSSGKSADWVKIYVGAEYGYVQDGKPIYPEWNGRIHAADVVPFEPSHIEALNPPIILGQDFGLTPAAVFCQRASDGQVQVFDELVSEDMGAVTFARELATMIKGQYPKRPVKGWGDPAGEQRSQVDERTPFEVVRAAGVPMSAAPTNDFTRRREAVAGLLLRLTMSGRPALAIGPKCKTLRKAMAGGYCYRRLQLSGDERYADKPDKGPYSHVAEALQYACVGMGEDRVAVHGNQRPRPVVVHRSIEA
jgi:hypothetical protein